jgi:hypothetical protein
MARLHVLAAGVITGLLALEPSISGDGPPLFTACQRRTSNASPPRSVAGGAPGSGKL